MPCQALQRNIDPCRDLQRGECVTEAVRRDMRKTVFRKKPFQPNKYIRTVTFSPAFDKKIYADVNVDMDELNRDLKSLSCSNIGIANYLDGHQLFSIDQLELQLNNSFRNDLC